MRGINLRLPVYTPSIKKALEISVCQPICLHSWNIKAILRKKHINLKQVI